MKVRWRAAIVLAGAAMCGLAACSSGAGGCSPACAAGEVCQNTHCVSACVASGGLLCGALCVNPLTDNANCGTCGTACRSGQACSVGTCAVTCASGYTSCTSDGGFYCANLAADISNCGICGTVCVPGDYCSAGTCKIPPANCPAGQTLCGPDGGGACVSLLGDNNNCGVCGAACDPGASCLGGICRTACPSGLLACPQGDAGATCVAVQTDPTNCGGCGQSCGSSGICVQGGCACPALFTQCGSAVAPECAVLALDPLNCGSCGHSCVACENCSLGACGAQAFLAATPGGIPLDGGAGSVAIGDFNGDGVGDLAVGQDTALAVFFGSAAGFLPAVVYPQAFAYYPAWVAAADFNGDGVSDLAVAYTDDSYTDQLTVLLGTPDAGFSALGPFSAAPPYGKIAGISTGDFNSDGLQDIAVLDFTSGLTVFYNDGAGGFTSVAGLPGISSTEHPSYFALASGDANGDGVSDLALLYYTNDGNAAYWLDVLIGNDGGVGPAMSSQVASNYGLALAVGGGTINAFVAGQLQTYAYDPDAGLLLKGSYSVPNVTTYTNTTAAVAQDMNGDGVVDLVAVRTNSVLLWLANDGGYDTPLDTPFNVAIPGGGHAGGLAVGALSGNGRADVAVSNGQFGPGGAIFLNTCAP